MAFTYCYLGDTKFSSDSNGNSYTSRYRVTSDEKTNNLAAAAASLNITTFETAYPYDAQSICQKVDCVPEAGENDDGYTFIVTVDYAWQQTSAIIADSPPNISWTFDNVERLYVKDANGNLIKNTAGDLPAEPKTTVYTQPIRRVRRNAATFDENFALTYNNAVNANTYLGAKPGHCQIRNIQSEQIFLGNGSFSYWTVSYDLYFDFYYGFDEVLLNEGYRELGDDGKLVDIKINGAKVSDPVLLGMDGKRLPEGQQPIYLTFRKFPRLPFRDF